MNDPAILRRHRFTYVTCPSGGGAGGFTQPWPELLAAGVNTNIGIDTHSNDYVENLKLAVIKGEARWSLARAASPVPMTRPTMALAVDAATLGAARGLGRDDLGRIAAGACADLCAIDVGGWFTGSGALPPEPLTNLLYANGLAVRHVMTDGQLPGVRRSPGRRRRDAGGRAGGRRRAAAVGAVAGGALLRG